MLCLCVAKHGRLTLARDILQPNGTMDDGCQPPCDLGTSFCDSTFKECKCLNDTHMMDCSGDKCHCAAAVSLSECIVSECLVSVFSWDSSSFSCVALMLVMMSFAWSAAVL